MFCSLCIHVVSISLSLLFLVCVCVCVRALVIFDLESIQ